MEREWILGGHPFRIRHSHGCYAPSTLRSRGNAPFFLLFLDCIWQIHSQYPCSFEFNEDFLLFLFEHAYASSFGMFFYLYQNKICLFMLNLFMKETLFTKGTFMCNNEAELMELKVKERTMSIWSHVNRPQVLEGFLNPLYDPNCAVLWPSVAPMSLVRHFASFHVIKN